MCVCVRACLETQNSSKAMASDLEHHPNPSERNVHHQFHFITITTYTLNPAPTDSSSAYFCAPVHIHPQFAKPSFSCFSLTTN